MVQFLSGVERGEGFGVNREQVKQTLREMIVRELRLSGITPDQIGDDVPLTGDRLGFDSIDILELLVAVEQRFGVRISTRNAAGRALESIDSLADFVISRRSSEH